MNNKTIYQVDAFTDRPFGGNPAGVMISDAPLSEDWMQSMAGEMNLSETAFVVPNDHGFDIRFFTPTIEIPLCGHATLASAYIIYELGLKQPHETIQFKAKGGDLTIAKEGDYVKMTFPQYGVSEVEIPKDFKKHVGFQPVAIYKADANWTIAIAEHQDTIAQCQPDFNALMANGLGHLMITSKGDDEEVDFVVRCFVPEVGINEDPVTGSAHCALTPLWAKLLGKTDMVSHQISKRKGVLKVLLKDNKVEIKGTAITIFKAELQL